MSRFGKYLDAVIGLHPSVRCRRMLLGILTAILREFDMHRILVVSARNAETLSERCVRHRAKVCLLVTSVRGIDATNVDTVIVSAEPTPRDVLDFCRSVSSVIVERLKRSWFEEYFANALRRSAERRERATLYAR